MTDGREWLFTSTIILFRIQLTYKCTCAKNGKGLFVVCESFKKFFYSILFYGNFFSSFIQYILKNFNMRNNGI